MNTLQQYFAGREQFIELLEAVGICTLEQFSSIDPFTVLPELHQAKRMLNLQTDIPSAPVFQEWVNQALTKPTAPDPSEVIIPDSDTLPIATLIEAPQQPSQTTPIREKRQHHHNEGPLRHISPKVKLQEEQNYRPAKHVQAHHEEKHYLRRKGIKHMTPWQTWLGATCVLLLFVAPVISIIVTVLALINGEQGWAIMGICFGPCLLALILYFSLALPRKCSVCRVHIFSFKKYTRNKAAHHITLMGCVFATALHIFLFRWFRCPACGSSQQLEKSQQKNTSPP